MSQETPALGPTGASEVQVALINGRFNTVVAEGKTTSDGANDGSGRSVTGHSVHRTGSGRYCHQANIDAIIAPSQLGAHVPPMRN
jgi:hypothetical protein